MLNFLISTPLTQSPQQPPADWEFASLVVSAMALFISAFSLLFVVLARPRFRTRITPIRREGEFLGDVVDVFNSGRRSFVLLDAGVLDDDGSIFLPGGDFDQKMQVRKSERLPLVVSPGGAVTLHFPISDTETRDARKRNGYAFFLLTVKLPWRKKGERRVVVPVRDLGSSVR